MLRRPSLCLLALALWCAGTASAQVLRCTNARTGEVTYTDGSCAPGSQTREIEARKTPEELRAEREQAAEALARKEQRLQREAAEQERADRADARALAERRANARLRPDYAHSAACLESRRQLNQQLALHGGNNVDEQLRLQALQRQVDLDCLGPERYAEIERLRPPAPAPVVVAPPYWQPPYRPLPPPPPPPVQPPPRITNCNVFRCYDERGGVHPR